MAPKHSPLGSGSKRVLVRKDTESVRRELQGSMNLANLSAAQNIKVDSIIRTAGYDVQEAKSVINNSEAIAPAVTPQANKKVAANECKTLKAFLNHLNKQGGDSFKPNASHMVRAKFLASRVTGASSAQQRLCQIQLLRPKKSLKELIDEVTIPMLVELVTHTPLAGLTVWWTNGMFRKGDWYGCSIVDKVVAVYQGVESLTLNSQEASDPRLSNLRAAVEKKAEIYIAERAAQRGLKELEEAVQGKDFNSTVVETYLKQQSSPVDTLVSAVPKIAINGTPWFDGEFDIEGLFATTASEYLVMIAKTASEVLKALNSVGTPDSSFFFTKYAVKAIRKAAAKMGQSPSAAYKLVSKGTSAERNAYHSELEKVLVAVRDPAAHVIPELQCTDLVGTCWSPSNTVLEAVEKYLNDGMQSLQLAHLKALKVNSDKDVDATKIFAALYARLVSPSVREASVLAGEGDYEKANKKLDAVEAYLFAGNAEQQRILQEVADRLAVSTNHVSQDSGDANLEVLENRDEDSDADGSSDSFNCESSEADGSDEGSDLRDFIVAQSDEESDESMSSDEDEDDISHSL